MLSSLRIGMRLRILMFVQCVLIGVGLTGLSGVAEARGRAQDVYGDSIVPLFYLDSLLSLNFQARDELAAALAAETPVEAQKHLDRIAGFSAEADKAWKDYSAAGMSVGERKLAEEAGQAHLALVAARDQVTAAFQSHGHAYAVEVEKRVDWTAKFERWRVAVDRLIEHQARDAESSYEAANGNYAQAEWIVAAMLLLGVGLAVVVSWLVIRSITRRAEPA